MSEPLPPTSNGDGRPPADPVAPDAVTPAPPAAPQPPAEPAAPTEPAAPAEPAAPTDPAVPTDPTVTEGTPSADPEQVASFADEPAADERPAPAAEPEVSSEPEQLCSFADEPAADPAPEAGPEAAIDPAREQAEQAEQADQADQPAELPADYPQIAPPVAADEEASTPAAHRPYPPATGSSSLAWLPLVALGVILLGLLIANGVLAVLDRQEEQRLEALENARTEAVAAARDAARLLFSYNHETLEEDFEKGVETTTGEFREEYSRTTEEVVSPVAEQYQAVVEAVVVEAGVVEASPDEVTTLVFLNQATTSTRVQGQQVDQSRVRMRLVERDGRWLVEAVDAL